MIRILVFALLSAIVGCSADTDPDVTELIFATPYSPSHPFSRADQRWIEFVEQESSGKLKVRPIWSGGLLSSEHSLIELRHGVADVGLITPIYVRGGAHLIRVQSGFYSGLTEIEDQVALYRCLLEESPEMEEEMEGLVVLAVQGGNLPWILTRDRPVQSLDDLKGMRIRAPTELLAVLEELGADPINMPMGDVYSALAKGVLDGVVAPADTFKALHFAEVTRYATALEIPRGAYPARAIGTKRWNSLSDEQRDVLQRGISVWEAALAEENRRSQIEGTALAGELGIEVFSVDESEQVRFDELYLEDAAQNAKSLERFGIDGLSVFNAARQKVSPDGSVICKGNNA